MNLSKTNLEKTGEIIKITLGRFDERYYRRVVFFSCSFNRISFYNFSNNFYGHLKKEKNMKTLILTLALCAVANVSFACVTMGSDRTTYTVDAQGCVDY